MGTQYIPNVMVGSWYQVRPEPAFEIVAIDEDAETIEVQYLDGTLQEFDFSAWHQMPVEPAAAPADYTAALDMDHETYDLDEYAGGSDNWGNPLDQIDLYQDDLRAY